MSGLQQFDFSNGPVVISDHYGSGPVSITSSCPWILLPKSNRNSNYCTMSFLVADFVGYFVISNNNKNNDDDDEYIFRSPTPIFKGVDGTVAYSDPTASELTFLNKDLIRLRLDSKNSYPLLTLITQPPPETAAVACRENPGCESRKGVIFWMYQDPPPSLFMFPKMDSSGGSSTALFRSGIHAGRVVFAFWMDCRGSCRHTLRHDKLDAMSSQLEIQVKYFYGVTDYFWIDGDLYSMVPRTLQFGKEIVIEYQQSPLSEGMLDYKRFLIVDYWIKSLPKGISETIQYSDSGQILFPPSGIGIPPNYTHTWYIYLPPKKELVLWFTDFKFFSDSGAVFSVSIPSNSSFDPVLIKPHWAVEPPLIVVPPQSILQKVQITIFSGINGGSGFALNYLVGIENFNNFIDVSTYPRDVYYALTSNFTTYGIELEFNDGNSKHHYPNYLQRENDGEYFIVISNKNSGGTLSVYYGIDWNIVDVRCIAQFYLSNGFYDFTSPTTHTTSRGYSADSILIRLPKFCFNYPVTLYFYIASGTAVSRPYPIATSPLRSSKNFIMYSNMSDHEQGIQAPYIALWTPQEIYTQHIPDFPDEILSFHGCQDSKFAIVGTKSDSKKKLLIIAQISTEGVVQEISSAEFDINNFGNVFAIDKYCSTMVSAESPSGRISLLEIKENKQNLTIQNSNSFYLYSAGDFRGISFLNGSTFVALGREMAVNVTIPNRNIYQIGIYDWIKFSFVFYRYFAVDSHFDDFVSFTVSHNGMYLAVGYPTLRTIVISIVEDFFSEKISRVIITADENEDEMFGKQILFTVDDINLISLGSTIRIFNLADIFEDTKNGTLDELTQIYTTTKNLSYFPINVFPNRFTSTHQDIVNFFNNLGDPNVHMVVNEFGLMVFENPRNFILLPFGEEGHETFVIGRSVNDTSQKRSCPPGSYKPEHFISTCFFCPYGYYQNNSVRSSCEICPENFVCPPGTVDPLMNFNMSTYSYVQNFSTLGTGDIQQEIISDIVLGAWKYPILGIWFLIASLGVYLHYGEDTPGKVKLSKAIRKFNIDKKIHIDPVTGKVFTTPSIEDVLVFLARASFLFVAILWMLNFYASYSQYHDDKYSWSAKNGDRSEKFLPTYLANFQNQALLEILKSKAVKINVTFNGITGTSNPCKTVEESLIDSSTVGCFYNKTQPCGDIIKPYIENPTSSLSYCNAVWLLSEDYKLDDSAIFSFSIGNTFTQSVTISIGVEGFTTKTKDGNTLTFLHSNMTDNVIIPSVFAENGNILFNLKRNYEFQLIIRESQEENLFEENLFTYIIQIYFRPLSSTAVDGISSITSFMTTTTPNQIHIKLSTPFYYIFRKEAKTTQFGQLFLTMILVGITIVQLFYMLSVFRKYIWIIVKRLIACCSCSTNVVVDDPQSYKKM